MVKSLFKPFSGVYYHPEGFLPKIKTANFFALFGGIRPVFKKNLFFMAILSPFQKCVIGFCTCIFFCTTYHLLEIDQKKPAFFRYEVPKSVLFLLKIPKRLYASIPFYSIE
ncbi:hypothetical protein D4760_08660 [Eubacterium callanderi]|nr:hypothetical protein [Eubacterium callanderi]